jgi:hypothetical protein
VLFGAPLACVAALVDMFLMLGRPIDVAVFRDIAAATA